MLYVNFPWNGGSGKWAQTFVHMCNEFIPYFDLQQHAEVIPTEFKLEFQSSIHQRNEYTCTLSKSHE